MKLLLCISVPLAVIFGFMYIRERPAAENWKRHGSMLFQDDKLAKAYIKNFDNDTAAINVFFASRNMPPMTTELWMDADAVADLAAVIKKNNYDGVRLYLAKYPVLKDVPDPLRVQHDGGSYDNRLTIVVVTTKADPSIPGNHVDVFRNPETNAIEGLYNYHDVCPPTCPNGPPGSGLTQP